MSSQSSDPNADICEFCRWEIPKSEPHPIFVCLQRTADQRNRGWERAAQMEKERDAYLEAFSAVTAELAAQKVEFFLHTKPDLEKERNDAREKARVFWGTIKLYIRSQRCFTEAQNEGRIARALDGHPWLEENSCRPNEVEVDGRV